MIKLSNRSVRIIGCLSAVAERKEQSWFNVGSCLWMKGYSGLLALIFATNLLQASSLRTHRVWIPAKDNASIYE